jgi:hypothetical protein
MPVVRLDIDDVDSSHAPTQNFLVFALSCLASSAITMQPYKYTSIAWIASEKQRSEFEFVPQCQCQHLHLVPEDTAHVSIKISLTPMASSCHYFASTCDPAARGLL